jgi:hypothetical protein
MSTRVLAILFMLSVLVGCAREPAAEPPAPEPSAPAAATPEPPEPTAAQVPIPADFSEEASKSITPETYKAELASIASELEAAEKEP